MKKEIIIKAVAILTFLCGLFTLISVFSRYLLPLYLSYKFNIDTSNAGSIGIIGGADGPTAIYLSGRFTWHLFTAIFALITVLGIIYLVIVKYKKNHN